MEQWGNEIRDLDAARRRYPSGSLVQVLVGPHSGEYAVVESIDEAAYHELGEVIVWLDRGLGCGEYRPSSMLVHEITPGHQAVSSRSRGVRKRGVTRTAPSSPVSLSAS